jgi:hypothetical protein
MKSRMIVIAVCLLLFMPWVAIAQTPRAHRVRAKTEPAPLSDPSLLLHVFPNTNDPDGVINRLLTFQPAIPLGPVDVLKAYEEAMALIAQRLSDELLNISQRIRANQITRDEAEYLIQDRYEVAMMQHDVLSALHDSLEHDIAQAAKRPGRVSRSDTAVVVQPPPFALVRPQ